ncbi:hypothetical protein RRG08_051596 [Elysia crispata]|uniref:Uncharacterized protein n=1 Tax=Elysia crispata TaxID=231223 RepID=A0AAE1DSK8_9GAST|nr:hypothetical protein RRG08_051596 [Elysia crispata]
MNQEVSKDFHKSHDGCAALSPASTAKTVRHRMLFPGNSASSTPKRPSLSYTPPNNETALCSQVSSMKSNVPAKTPATQNVLGST